MALNIDGINTTFDQLMADPSLLQAMGSDEKAPEFKMITRLKAIHQEIIGNTNIAADQKDNTFRMKLQSMKAQMNAAFVNKGDTSQADAENSSQVVSATLQGAFNGIMSGDVLGGLLMGFKAALGNFIFGISAVKDKMLQTGEYVSKKFFKGDDITFEQAGTNVEERKIADRLAAASGMTAEELGPMLNVSNAAPVPASPTVDIKSFAQLNTDENKEYLSVAELAKLDKNKDNKLSESEIPDALKQEFHALLNSKTKQDKNGHETTPTVLNLGELPSQGLPVANLSTKSATL